MRHAARDPSVPPGPTSEVLGTSWGFLGRLGTSWDFLRLLGSSKTGRRRPKTTQDRVKTSQDRPKIVPRRGQNAARSALMGIFLRIGQEQHVLDCLASLSGCLHCCFQVFLPKRQYTFPKIQAWNHDFQPSSRPFVSFHLVLSGLF